MLSWDFRPVGAKLFSRFLMTRLDQACLFHPLGSFHIVALISMYLGDGKMGCEITGMV